MFVVLTVLMVCQNSKIFIKIRYRFIKLDLWHKPSPNCTFFKKFYHMNRVGGWRQHSKTSKYVTIFLLLQVLCNFSGKKERKFGFLKNQSVSFSFSTVNFFLQKRLIRFVIDLRVNGLCRLLTNASVNFRKPPFFLTELCPALTRAGYGSHVF